MTKKLQKKAQKQGGRFHVLCVDRVTWTGQSILNEFWIPTFPYGEGLVKF